MMNYFHVFLHEFCKISKNTFFTDLKTITSESENYNYFHHVNF